MKTEHLLYFIEAAKHGSLHKVAEEYYTSHQVIRKAIKSLESELNVELITTSNQGLKLTKGGEILLEYAKNVQSMTDSLKEELEQYALIKPRDKQKIDFFMTPYLTDSLILNFLDEYQKQKKDVVINIKSLPIDEMYMQLTQENAIFIIPTIEEVISNDGFQQKLLEHNLTLYVLKESPLYVCTYEKTKWSGLKYISNDDFDSLPVCVSSTTTLNTKFLLRANHQIVNSLTAQKSIIKKGLGVTLVTKAEFEFYYGDDKRYVIIPTALSPVWYVCVHKKDAQLPMYVTELLDSLRTIL